jgi:hypothetical protein
MIQKTIEEQCKIKDDTEKQLESEEQNVDLEI